MTTGAFFTLGPIFAEERGLTTGQIAVFMACGTLGGFVAAWPLSLLSDRYDRRLVIIGAAAAAAASLALMLALVPGDAYPWLLYLCVALFGGMIIPTYSLALAHLSDAVAQEEMVAASGGLLLAHGAGAAAGPLIAGFAMSATPRGLSYTLIVAQALIVLFGVSRLRLASAAARRAQERVCSRTPGPGRHRVRCRPFDAALDRALLRSTPGPCAAATNIGARIQAVGTKRVHRGASVHHAAGTVLASGRNGPLTGGGPRTGSIG